MYNLAAQSHVRVSFEHADAHRRENRTGGTSCCWKRVRDYQQVTGGITVRVLPGELLGDVRAGPRRRRRRCRPCSRAARTRCAKVYGCTARDGELPGGVRVARVVTGFCSTTSRRGAGETFVTRKITRAVTRIKLGLQEPVPRKPGRAARLGVRGGLRRGDVAMLQQDKPDDFVIATGDSMYRPRLRREGLRPRRTSLDKYFIRSIRATYRQPTYRPCAAMRRRLRAICSAGRPLVDVDAAHRA